MATDAQRRIDAGARDDIGLAVLLPVILSESRGEGCDSRDEREGTRSPENHAAICTTNATRR